MSEGVATGVLSGVVKVSGIVTGSIVNSKPGKKFFNLLPGEIILASLDGFSMRLFLNIYIFGLYVCVIFLILYFVLLYIDKVCDAIEVAGRNVMSTTSTVTTDFVSHRYLMTFSFY